MIEIPNIYHDRCDAAPADRLVLKPGYLTICAPDAIQFSAFIANRDGDTIIISGAEEPLINGVVERRGTYNGRDFYTSYEATEFTFGVASSDTGIAIWYHEPMQLWYISYLTVGVIINYAQHPVSDSLPMADWLPFSGPEPSLTAVGEVAATGVTYASSDTSIVSIDGAGLASMLAEGIATISATAGGLTAFAQVTVLAGATCCENLAVGSIILLDRSASMAQAFNASFANKFEAARMILRGYIPQLQSKDQMALEQFDRSPTIRAGLTNDTDFLLASLGAMSVYGNELEASGNSNIAAALDLAIDVLDICAEQEVPAGTTPGEVTPGEHNFHGNGPPAPTLGVAGDTYVDDDNNAFYWKSVSGWQP